MIQSFNRVLCVRIPSSLFVGSLLFYLGWMFFTSHIRADEPIREWKDTSGKFSVKAQFVRIADTNVIIRKSDGTNLEVPISRLSSMDLEYVSQRSGRTVSSLIPKTTRPNPNSNSASSPNANIAPEVLLDSELKSALAKKNRGEYAAAIEDLQALVRSNPKSRVLRLQLADCLRLDHAPAQAIDVITKVVEEAPKDQGALEVRAALYMDMTRDLEAKGDLEKLLQLGSQNPQTKSQLAWLLAASSQDDLRDGERALTLAKAACDATKYKNPSFLRTLAAAYAETGNFELARTWASEAYGMAQQHASTKLGDYEKALNQFIDDQPLRIQRASRLSDARMLAEEEYQRKLNSVLRKIDLELASKSPQRRETAFSNLMVLAKSKRPEVLSRLGNCCINGIGTLKSYRDAAVWFEQGHEQGDIDSTFGLAICNLFSEGAGSDREKGIELLKKAAEQKHAGAAAQLAHQYLNGQILDHDLKKAVPLLQIAALKRNSWGMATLGECYLSGRGIPQNVAAGKNWVTLAAQQGDLAGMLLCGHYHAFGKHADSNSDEGVAWLEKCSTLGHSDAKRLLGLYYYSTPGPKRDINKGIALLEASSESGNMKSQLALSEIFMFGDESIRSPAKALEYITPGVQAEEPASLYLYAVCYLSGQGVEVDTTKALELLQKSSQGGERRATELLAQIDKLQREQEREAQLAAEEARRVAEAERIAEEERLAAEQRANAYNSYSGNSYAYQSSDDEQMTQAAAAGILAIGALILLNGFSSDSDDYSSDEYDEYQRQADQRRYNRDYWADRARREAEYGDHAEAARSAAMAQSYGY